MRFLIATAMMLMTTLALAADLTKGDVTLWLSASDEMEGWLQENEDKLPEYEFSDNESSVEAMFEQGLAELKKAGLYNEFDNRAKKAGFDGAEHWADISRRISMSFVALEMENEQVSLSQLEAQLKQVRESGLPEEQKAAMIQMMEASLGMLRAVNNVSDADKDAVRPYRNEIEKKFSAGMEE